MPSPTDSLPDLLERAFRYALSLTHSRALAEDILQEACVGVSRQGGPWKIAYVLAAVRNRYVDYCRRNAVMKFEPLGEIEPASSALSPADADLSFDGPMAKALARLKPEERELLYLSAVEGHSTKELMKLTGRPRGSVLSDIHRAKVKLRQWLEQSTPRTSV